MEPLRRPIVVASNRGPVTFDLRPDGTVEERRGGGGLVTALSGVLSSTGGEWIAAAMTEGDRAAAERAPDGLVGASRYALRYLPLPRAAFDRAYHVVSNRVLWFLHHYLFDVARTPSFGPTTEAAWSDYRAVNRRFARALAEAGRGRDPAYLVQDYHLALVPRMLRDLRPDALVSHFTHTPFAGPGYLRILPTAMREELLRGLLGADVLGFHARPWSEAFLSSCREILGARVDLRRRTVELDGRPTLVREYPVGVDVAALRRQASAPEVEARGREIRRWRADARLVVRVDRMELSKNVLRGFLAFEDLLRRRPEWRGRVRFLALLNPSRRGVPEYRAYAAECLRAAERVNGELGGGEDPIEVSVRDDLAGSLAAYREYDALLVNPTIDGMNLVAMEGPALNRRRGVLVLSEAAGVAGRLGRHALTVNPFDVGETAEALHTALVMSEEERARRSRGLVRAVSGSDPERWALAQIEDLERVAADRA